MPAALPVPDPVLAEDPTWPVIKVPVPPAWKAALKEASKVQAVSVAALVRLQLGPFVRERLR